MRHLSRPSIPSHRIAIAAAGLTRIGITNKVGQGEAALALLSLATHLQQALLKLLCSSAKLSRRQTSGASLPSERFQHCRMRSVSDLPSSRRRPWPRCTGWSAPGCCARAAPPRTRRWPHRKPASMQLEITSSQPNESVEHKLTTLATTKERCALSLSFLRGNRVAGAIMLGSHAELVMVHSSHTGCLPCFSSGSENVSFSVYPSQHMLFPKRLASRAAPRKRVAPAGRLADGALARTSSVLTLMKRRILPYTRAASSRTCVP